MPSKKEIWVVGHAQTNADKSFSWDDKSHSITDADIIIVDIGTLPTASQLKAKSRAYINPESTDTAISYLINDNRHETMINPLYETYLRNVNGWICTLTHNMENKVLGGGHVILLLHYHKEAILVYPKYHSLMPFNITIHNDEIRSKIIFGKHYLKEYLNHIKHVNYKLNSDSLRSIIPERDLTVVDNSAQLLGEEYVYSDAKQPGEYSFQTNLDYKNSRSLKLKENVLSPMS